MTRNPVMGSFYIFNSIFPDKVNRSICMSGGRKELLDNVLRAQLQAARAHTGVAAQVLVPQDVLIDQECDIVSLVIHEPHDTDGSRLDVQIFQHIVFPGKR